MLFDNTCVSLKTKDRQNYVRSFDWWLFLPLNGKSWQPKTLTGIALFTCLSYFSLFLLEIEHQTFRLWFKRSNYQTAYQRPEGKQNNEIVANQSGGSRNFRKGVGGPGAVQFLRSWVCFDSPSHMSYFCRKIKE